MSNNTVATISNMEAIQSDDFYPDETEPELLSYNFDRISGELLLTFSEVIDHESQFNFATVTVLNDSSIEIPLNYTLKEIGTIYSTGLPNKPEYTLRPTLDDVSNLKRVIGLATTDYNTFLTLMNTTTLDFSSNPLNETFALQVNQVYEDQAKPSLIGFLFDVNAGELLLTFNDVMEALSLNVTEITFFSSNSTSSENYTLSGGQVDDFNDYMLLVSLTDDDQNEIKVMINLASHQNNTYIKLEQNSVYDTAGNGIAAFGEPLGSTEYVYDTIRPSLISWNISIDAGEIYLLFTEAVAYSSLDATVLTLQNATVSFDSFVLSSASFAEPPDAVFVVVNISRRDLDTIKDKTLLATNIDDTYLSFDRSFIVDMNMNSVTAIQMYKARQAFFVFEDETPPELVSFTLNLEESHMILSFSETINPSTFNITEIKLHNNAPSLTYQEFQITSQSNYERTDYSVVIIYLSLSDLNSIKSVYNLGTERENTYISFTPFMVEDRNDNKIEAVNAFIAANVGQDMIRPELEYFEIDFTNANFTIYFSETVNVRTFDVTQITFVHNHTDVSYTLTGGEPTNENHEAFITITFTKIDRDNITRLPLCNQKYDCLLSFTTSLVNDTMDNRVRSRSMVIPRQYVGDTSSTYITSFDLLDFNSGTITIEFEEIIDSETIEPRALRLQNIASGGGDTVVMLTGGNVTSSNGTRVTIVMTNDDLNVLKAMEISQSLCRIPQLCYIRLLASFANDTFGNPITPVENSMSFFAEHIPDDILSDTTRPMLVEFDLDLTNETVTLYFDETIDYTVFSSRYITIQNAKYNATTSYTLDADDQEHTQEYLPTITFTLLPQDVVAIKALETLATGQDDTYISLTSSLVTDTSGSPITPIDIENALQVQTYTNDSIPPELISFTLLDMNEGIITLSFSEPINASTIEFSEFTLHSDTSGDGPFSLTGGNTSFPDPDTKLVLEIIFSAPDLRQIKLLQDLASNRDSSYLSFTSNAILDMAGNPVVAIEPTQPEQADDFIPDQTSPVVLSFVLNMNTSELIITFNDVINRETLQPQYISFQNTIDGTDDDNEYTLTRGFSDSPDGYEIIVKIHSDDLNQLKMRDGLATEINTTYLVLTANSFKEVAGSAVSPLLPDNALIANDFQPDVTRPKLLDFSLNLEDEVLVFIFSEAVNVSSLDLTLVTLQNKANGSEADESYALTGGTPDPSYTGVNVTISLTQEDLNAIKGMTMLGTTVNNSYISFPETVIFDMNRQPIVAIESTSAHKAFSLERDIFPPTVVQYCLNMSDNVFLELTFSETINKTSIEPSFISLQSSPGSNPLALYRLTGGTVTTENEILVQIHLTTEDSNEIKRFQDVATDSTNTYLTFLNGMAYDYALPRLPIVEVTDGIPVNETCYIPDVTPPVLDAFNLDLGNDTLTLFFSETVSVDQFNFTGITLIGDSPNSLRQLTGGELLTDDSHIISFSLAFDDANFVKNISELATTDKNAYIILTNETVRDMNGNAIETIEPENAVPITNLTFDETSPRLDGFNFDLDNGKLTLFFSETVDVATLDVTQITMHDGPDGEENHTISSASFSNSPNGPVVVIQLSDNDLNQVKHLPALATHADYTWITITSDSINDTSNNQVTAVIEPQMVNSDGFIADDTNPRLLGFRFDTNDSLIIVLTFSETVNVDTLDPTQFEFRIYQDNDCMLNNCTYNLTGGNTSSVNSTEVTIYVTQTDLEAIRLVPPLGHTRASTFLSISQLAIEDMGHLLCRSYIRASSSGQRNRI